MEIIVVTPSGARVTAEQLAGHLINRVTDGDDGALRTLRHAREGREASESTELAAFIDALLGEPERAGTLASEAADETLARFAYAAAIAYQQRTPDAALDMVPEDEADRLFLEKRGIAR